MATIGIFDSGCGGLSVFREIRRILPNENYLYWGDNAYCPYGPKGPDFIVDRSRKITEFLLQNGADAIVVACNTATSYSIDILRDEFSVPFIGMVPAVKPAVQTTKTGVIGVLATKGTLNAPLYNRIKESYGKDVQIVEHIGEGFVELVESLELEGENAYSIVSSSVRPLLSQKADVLVLGCTHYPFLCNLITHVAEDLKPCDIGTVQVIDPAPAVAKHLYDVLADSGVPINTGKYEVELLSSGEKGILESLYEKFIKTEIEG